MEALKSTPNESSKNSQKSDQPAEKSPSEKRKTPKQRSSERKSSSKRKSVSQGETVKENDTVSPEDVVNEAREYGSSEDEGPEEVAHGTAKDKAVLQAKTEAAEQQLAKKARRGRKQKSSGQFRHLSCLSQLKHIRSNLETQCMLLSWLKASRLRLP